MKRAFIVILFIIMAFSHSSQSAASMQTQQELEQKLQKIDNNLQAMIGQMLMFGMRGQSLAEDVEIQKMLSDGKVGGIILFYTHGNIVPYNLANKAQIISLINELQKNSPYPLFIGVDQEGGKVQRLSSKNGFKDFPTAYSLGKIDNEEHTFPKKLR